MTRIVTLTLNPALDFSTETATVAPDRKLRCAAPRIDPGGGGVNVSRAIANLGGESLPLVAAGGRAGAHLMALLRGAGLQPVDLGAPGETRRSMAVRDLDSGAQYRFLMPGPAWSPADAERIAVQTAAATQPGDLVVVSGSPPPGLAGDFFLTLNDRLAPLGARMILDTSGPALTAAAQCVAAQSAAQLARGLHVLRMDHEEAEALAGALAPGVAAAADFAAALAAQGAARIVAVACGAEGTVVATPEGRWHARPPKVAVVSKVGAGDSFVAAFTLALSRGEAAQDACAAGVAAAAAAVTTPDTQLCDRETVARLLAQVTTAPI